MKKKNYMSSFLIGCVLLFYPFTAEAASSVEVPMTVKQFFLAEEERKEIDLTGTYEFRTLEAENPMPDESQNGIYTFLLEGKQAEQKIYLTYDHAGVYHYELIQTTSEKEDYIYDAGKYRITLYIQNGNDGTLFPEVVAEKEDGKKSGELKFVNRYKTSETGTPAPQKPIPPKPEKPEPGKPQVTPPENLPENPPTGIPEKSAPGVPVKTGDQNNGPFYLVTGIAALCLILALLFRKMRHTDHRHKSGEK